MSDGRLGSYPLGTVGYGAGALAFTQAGMANMLVFVEVDFSRAVDPLAPDTNTGEHWGAATWGTGRWVTLGRYTDVTPWVRGVQIVGQHLDRLSGAYTAATATVTLRNTDGRFSPDNNVSSPYRLGSSTAIGLLRPFRIRGIYSDGADVIEFTLFKGKTLTWNETFPLQGNASEVTVTAVDGFGDLANFQAYATLSVGGGELSGARINRMLDVAGWTGPRYIDTGLFEMAATTLEGNILGQLRATAEAEGGAVWCDPSGGFHFDNGRALREKTYSTTTQVTFTGDGADGSIKYLDPKVSHDAEIVVNSAAFQRVGGTMQVAQSDTSVHAFGYRQVSRTDLVNNEDADVLTLATREVALNSKPERRIEQLTFVPIGQGSDAANTAAMRKIADGTIQLRALARAVVTLPAGYDIDKNVYIQGITHTITRTMWTVDLNFASASVYTSLNGSHWGTGQWNSSNWVFG